ncbi:hypothetical protein BDN72DRAFT_829983 [Pluteus cervinus]|uniref:Uncharacterized protein n=1 Tax=Pluteus cervinus TaxID=181527 RepID=A0ACD3BG14_9AGAR|nr:hypothetical protein BDN72DRAFT_829983 [Pluteus cervinus]
MQVFHIQTVIRQCPKTKLAKHDALACCLCKLPGGPPPDDQSCRLLFLLVTQLNMIFIYQTSFRRPSRKVLGPLGDPNPIKTATHRSTAITADSAKAVAAFGIFWREFNLAQPLIGSVHKIARFLTENALAKCGRAENTKRITFHVRGHSLGT